MVLEKSDVFFYDTLVCMKTCLYDVALVRGWNGVYDVYKAVADVLSKTDGEVKADGEDREKEWYVVWDGYGCRLCDECVGEDVMYVRVKCRNSGLMCLYDVYITLPSGIYNLNLNNFEK